jgi:hypothetical protein
MHSNAARIKPVQGDAAHRDTASGDGQAVGAWLNGVGNMIFRWLRAIDHTVATSSAPGCSTAAFPASLS